MVQDPRTANQSEKAWGDGLTCARHHGPGEVMLANVSAKDNVWGLPVQRSAAFQLSTAGFKPRPRAAQPRMEAKQNRPPATCSTGTPKREEG